MNLTVDPLAEAAETIKRLEAERNIDAATIKYKDELISKHLAHLATMRRALEVVRGEAGITLDALDVVEQALATDAGKEAAAVLEAAVEIMDDGKFHVTDRFINAVRAYRATLDGDKSDV